MATNYDTIALEYRKAKQQPWRRYVEAHTLTQLVGDVKGKSVLDLACGEGFCSRLLKRQGAARVVGVDVSARMIDLARQEEVAHPLGIEYLVHDAQTLDLGEQFDLVTADYLLNYARTAEELLQMCRVIAQALKPGGRFVGANNNPGQPLETYSASAKYGFVKELRGPLQEGTPVVAHLLTGKHPLELVGYYLSAATHEWAFREVGLELHWRPLQLAPEGAREFGRDYWAELLRDCPVIFLEGRK